LVGLGCADDGIGICVNKGLLALKSALPDHIGAAEAALTVKRRLRQSVRRMFAYRLDAMNKRSRKYNEMTHPIKLCFKISQELASIQFGLRSELSVAEGPSEVLRVGIHSQHQPVCMYVLQSETDK
jgi:hypothetical protein